MKELLDTLESRIRDLAAYASNLKNANQELGVQIADLQEKLAQCPTEPADASDFQAASDSRAQIVALQTELAQQAERFRIEFSLIKQQHEQNLHNLNQAFAVQSALLKEQLAAAQAKAQTAQVQAVSGEMQALQTENRRLQNLLKQSAAQAAALAQQLAGEK